MGMSWQHSGARRRWELTDLDAGRDRLIGYVTDEFLRNADLSRGQLEEYVARRCFGVPLPAEAFAVRTQRS